MEGDTGAGNLNTKQIAIVGGIVLVALIAIGAYLLFMKPDVADQEADLSGATRAVEDVPQTNPFEKSANPFSDYKNPFE